MRISPSINQSEGAVALPRAKEFRLAEEFIHALRTTVEARLAGIKETGKACRMVYCGSFGQYAVRGIARVGREYIRIEVAAEDVAGDVVIHASQCVIVVEVYTPTKEEAGMEDVMDCFKAPEQ